MEAIDAAVPRERYELRTVDITRPENVEWLRQYRYDIPVFHLNGVFLMKHRANCKLLLDELDKLTPRDERV